MSQYQIDLPVFTGPLDLLLHLIERQELDITAVSLVQVTAQYLEQIEQMKENRMEQLIDFLVVAARLVLIKSRALLPQTNVLIEEEEEEEDPAEALIRQLRQYKRFKTAAAWLSQREADGLRTYLRVAPPPRLEGRLDMSGISVETLMTAVLEALARATDKEESVALVQPRRITIESQITKLRHRVKNGGRVQFGELLTKAATRIEISITLLAVLELIKRHEVIAVQPDLFGPIDIVAAPAAETAAAPSNSHPT